jgi:hypothetical protein
MAGNLLYIPYTISLIIGLIVIGLLFWFKLGKRMTKTFLVISIPIFVITQFYFWNLEFNDYVKSYLFPSKSYVCEYDEEHEGDIEIPLPKRTVFHGKQDGCYPLYSTYISDNYFINFYENELHTMKNTGEVQNYHYVEQNNQKGFEVQLSTGARVDIFIKRYPEINEGLITIDFELDN